MVVCSTQWRYTKTQMLQCTKCGVEERKTGQRWCRKCFNAYEREHRKTVDRRGFVRGFEALRRVLVAKFHNIGPGQMTGYTAEEIVRTTSAEP